MPAPTRSSFQLLDWLVLAAYFAVVIITGYIFSRRRGQTTEDYFLGSRRMPVWAVAISVLASSLSAATFIGAPVESYTGDLTYLSTNIGSLIAIAVVAIFFIPVFYRHNVATVYGLLERRFGKSSKLASSWMFMIGRVFASGARLYMGAIPLAMILFGDLDEDPAHLLVAVGVLTVAGICYSIMGGISSVIWTEVIQTAVLVGAVVAAVIWLLIRIPLPPGEIIHQLASTPTEQHTTKTTLITLGLDISRPNLGFNPSQSYTLLTALLGFSLMGVGSYGTDHDLAQRMLTCRSAARGSWSAVMGILIGIPVTTLFLIVGLLLYVFYQRPDIMGDAAPDYHITKALEPKVFPLFILRHMPGGLAGLMFAGLFAAGLSTLMSALNAMSSAFVSDVYRPARPGRAEAHYVRAGRLAMASWGIVLGGFAGFCIYWQQASGDTLIKFALGVMTFAYAGLIGVFFTALFTRRGNNTSVLAALATGFVAVLLMQPIVWTRWTPHMPMAGPWLSKLDLAFPWRLTIATTLAFIVCCTGSSRDGSGGRSLDHK